MRQKHILALALLLVCQVSLDGCAVLGTPSAGSRAKVFDATALTNVHRIFILPMTASISDSAGRYQDDSATVRLWTEVASRGIFSVVTMDSVREALEQIQPSSDSVAIPKLAVILNADACILAHLAYSKGILENKAEVFLFLISPEPRKILLQASHNTYLGNGYFLPPSLETVRDDAIVGAVNAMQKSINQSRGQ